MNKDIDFDLGQQIAELRGLTQEGFRGVNARLDTLNSKVAKHEKRLNDMDVADATLLGRGKGVSRTLTILVTILAFLIGSIVVPIVSAVIVSSGGHLLI